MPVAGNLHYLSEIHCGKSPMCEIDFKTILDASVAIDALRCPASEKELCY
jgi:hypothetical protein